MICKCRFLKVVALIRVESRFRFRLKDEGISFSSLRRYLGWTAVDFRVEKLMFGNKSFHTLIKVNT